MTKLNSPNIYEADYEGFFNNVTHEGLEMNMMGEARIPKILARYLRTINQSIAKLQKTDPIRERDRKYLNTRTMGLGSQPGRIVLYSDIERHFPQEIAIQG
jgi:hypothetical protein